MKKNTATPFFRKIHDLVYMVSLVALIVMQSLLHRYLGIEAAPDSREGAWLDLIIHLLSGLCLLGFFVKKYNPDFIRTAFMIIFLAELVLGIFLKKLQIRYSNEVVFIGLLGILITWFNTHLNRKKFTQEED